MNKQLIVMCFQLYQSLTYKQRRLFLSIVRQFEASPDLPDRYIPEFKATVGQLCLGKIFSNAPWLKSS